MAPVLSKQVAHLEKMPSTTRRPKLLFFAYYFPPLNSSGCVRSWNIAKYLARAGWDVTVVTPEPALWRKVNDLPRVEADIHREGIRQVLTGHRWRCLSPWDLKCNEHLAARIAGGMCRKVARYFGVEMVIGWEREAERACVSLSSNDVDVILASGPPFVSFRLAKSLSMRLGRPYVLDYRDPWVVRGPRQMRSRVVNHEEKDVVECCSAVTVISPSLLNGRLALGSKQHVIANGFDPEELTGVPPHDFGHFAIVYAGNFYPPRRVITPVMAAIRKMVDQKIGATIPWKFHYYGGQGEHVRSEAERFGVMENVVIHGAVSRKEALSAVRGSRVSVVITSVLEDKAEKDGGIVTGKLFEALGMETPVLFIGPSGSDAEAIFEAAGMVRRCSATDVEGMTAFIREIMNGKVPAKKNPDDFAWPNLVKRFDAVLRKTVRADAALS